MKWTKELPTKPGWYWCHRVPYDPKPFMVEIQPDVNWCRFKGLQKTVRDFVQYCESLTFWSGPIPEPEEK